MANFLNGGAFVPEGDYAPTGEWDFSDATVTFPSGTVESGGSIALTDLTNQVVTGGGSNLTTSNFPASSGAVTLTFPNTTDTVVGRATTDTLTNKTLTAPAIVGATITGTVTVGNGSTITTPVLSGTVTGTYTLGGTPTLASAAGVPYVAGAAAGYKLARSAAPVAVTGTSDITTGLTSVIAAGCNSEAALDGDTIANCSVTITGGAGHILLQTWKVTTGGAAGNPTLIAASVAKNLTWWAIGT